MTAPTLFLDRDGTINVDMGSGYLNRPEDAKLIPNAGKAIIKAKNAGFKIAIITNQAGIAKGITKQDALPHIHDRLCELIAQEAKVSAFSFDDIQVCMHHPDKQCYCRKPETQNLLDSMAKLESKAEKSFFVGDKSSDIVCANRVGLKSILVLTGHGKKTKEELESLSKTSRDFKPTYVAADLLDAVDWILNHHD